MIISRYSQTFLQANTYIIVPDVVGGASCGSAGDAGRAADGGGAGDGAAVGCGIDGDGGWASDGADVRGEESAQPKALVVDPGAGSAQWVAEELARRGAQLGAVLLTHGHPDHMWDAHAVAADTGAPVYVPSPDMYRLDDPLSTLGMPEANLGFMRMGASSEWVRPAHLHALPFEMYSRSYELIPGLPMRAVATPGHTEGSSIFLFSGVVSRAFDMELESPLLDAPERTYLLAGDVLFAGSVGRTDLPGGDQYEMNASLRFIVNSIKPDVYVLPGHGPHTSIWNETRNNPYLHAAMS